MTPADPVDPRVLQALHALPEPEPPAALRARVLDACLPATAATVSPRRRRAGLALAAAVLGAALLAPWPERPEAPVDPRPVAHAVAPHPGLRQIDRALQDAYASGAGEQELAALWAARDAAAPSDVSLSVAQRF